MTTAAELRDVLQRVPTGVSVLTVASGAQRIGLTVATLVSLSLDPPLVGVAVVDGSDAPLLADAVGWLECSLRDELAAGTHTLFVLDVRHARTGRPADPLVRVGGSFR